MDKRELAKKIGYRGKLEKFDEERGRKILASRTTKPKPTWGEEMDGIDDHVERRKAGAKKAQQSAKPRPTLDKPQFVEENKAAPTPQRNDPIWSEAIFGVDVILRELDQVTEFTPSYARLSEITRAAWMLMLGDDDRLNRKITLELLNYHTTAILWARLLDVKAKRGHTELTETERNFRRYFTDKDVHILQPIYTYLRGIGNVVDKRGKQIYLQDCTLPAATFGNRTGYHAPAAINQNTHNLYGQFGLVKLQKRNVRWFHKTIKKCYIQ